MSFWKKTMDYLGLGPDDAYDDYDDQVEPEAPSRSSRGANASGSQGGRSSAKGSWPTESDETAIRAVPRRVRASRRVTSSRRPPGVTPGDDSGMHSRPTQRPATPRVTTSPAEPATVRPRRFDQAQELADKFKDGQSVILNLEATERDVARRLIDFASGVCYSLDGSMEKVATGVYLLKPAPNRVHRFDDYES